MSIIPCEGSSVVENALVNKLRDDADLAALLPDGVFYGRADAGCTRFAIVSMATSHDERMFTNRRAFEEYNFLIKAVVLNDEFRVASQAAARIDALLDPPTTPATLEMECGYRLMSIRRLNRVRYPDPDPNDPNTVWEHRGGNYEVMVYQRVTA